MNLHSTQPRASSGVTSVGSRSRLRFSRSLSSCPPFLRHLLLFLMTVMTQWLMNAKLGWQRSLRNSGGGDALTLSLSSSTRRAPIYPQPPQYLQLSPLHPPASPLPDLPTRTPFCVSENLLLIFFVFLWRSAPLLLKRHLPLPSPRLPSPTLSSHPNDHQALQRPLTKSTAAVLPQRDL